MKRHFSILVFLLAAGIFCSGAARADEAGAADAAQIAKRDAEYRKLIVGTWGDNYQGRRTMTLRPDGTGLMVVELSGLKARLYASRLDFDMKWAIENGRLKKQTIGGRPSGKVNLILKMMGDRVDEPILELTKERLLLLDANGKTKYDWGRLVPGVGNKTEQAEPSPELPREDPTPRKFNPGKPSS
jgi:hypothetical protein